MKSQLGRMAALLVAASVAFLFSGAEAAPSFPITEAIAVVSPNPSGVVGSVRFVKGSGCTVVGIVRLAGLKPNSVHGFHIHELGNVTGGCASTGDHWNPTRQTHGAPSAINSHAGDLGNIVADDNGVVELLVSNPTLSAFGIAATYGRAVVVHNNTDDLGLGGNSASLANGQAGSRIACGVIGRTSVVAGVEPGECDAWASVPTSVYDSGVATISGGVAGVVHFTVSSGCSVLVNGKLTGLRPNSLLGFHVHEYGDLSGGCGTTGLHWNPAAVLHGSPDFGTSHAGDLGNIRTDERGVASVSVSNPIMSAFGVRALYGRAIVVHNMTDDVGLGGNSASSVNGNAGARIACAIIGVGRQSCGRPYCH